MKIFLLVSCTMLGFNFYSSAQDKLNFKFGNVKPGDFDPTAYAIDSSADAIILGEMGSTEIVGNQKGSFSLEFKNYRRARILKKSGYDIANVEIPVYTDGRLEEQVDNLKAVTYNLENGKVVETKLDLKSSVFKDKINKNLVIMKFTLPSVKEGSIIEYQYTLNSDYIFNLQPWSFQGAYPCLWSEYNFAMPEFYSYVVLTQGYHSFSINAQNARKTTFRMADNGNAGPTERLNFDATVVDHRWVMKNIPALKLESYTSTLKNHIAKIEFQLSSVNYPFTYRQLMGTWPGVTKSLLEDEDFGLQLKKDNGWLNDIMPVATKGAKDNLQKAKNIFAWVRDNYTCTDHDSKYLSHPLKNLLKAKNGNEADINLLLTAMLRKADLQADPVLLSTRGHGYTHAIYPLMDRFNYVISRLQIDGKDYYLDASEPRLGFGKLKSTCYNGHSRVINEEATSLELSADQIQENSTTTVFIINDEKGNMVGSVQKIPGYYESYSIRDKVKDKGADSYLKEEQKGFGMEVSISNTHIDSLEKYDGPVAVNYEFDIKEEKEDIMYINPMFGDGYKENPFKSAERFYPVEMPYTIDEVYSLQMEIPAGYTVDELPKQAVVKMNEEGDAVFEYRISSSGNNISFRSRLIVKRTFFAPEEYEMLREFYNFVVKKHSEQVVFKKKK